jgi:phospholipase/carboxylesterase
MHSPHALHRPLDTIETSMKTPGERVHGETYAFDFVTLEPRPDPPRLLAVLLHGVGGDETQLAALGARLPDDALVVLPRGQRSISGDRIGWFREALSEDGAQVVEDEAEDARARLVDFVGRLQQRFDVPPSRTVLVGYSQGGMLAASAALTCPAAVAGFAMLCGRIPPEIEPHVASSEALARLDALVLHGERDVTLEVEWAHRAREWLDALRVPHACRLHDAGHELTQGMEDDAVAWLTDACRAWNVSRG